MWIPSILVVLALIRCFDASQEANITSYFPENVTTQDPLQGTLNTHSSEAKGNSSRTATLVHVSTLTRYGSRAPNKVLAKVSCIPLFHSHRTQGLRDMFREKFGTLPGELTEFGQKQMVQVGEFIKKRYGKSGLDFVNTDQYSGHAQDWRFVARMGSCQQHSMTSIVSGIFKEPAPISVIESKDDAALGGPAPQCGKFTAEMIVDWHNTKGKELVKQNYEAVQPFERICDTQLKDDPVDTLGSNPHALIGDVSDLRTFRPLTWMLVTN